MSGTLSYDVRGKGPGLVLLHGTSSTGLGSWGTVLQQLSDKHTVVLPDLPGSGGSALPDGPLDISTIADQVVDTARVAGLSEFVVAGASLGAAVAVKVAARHPERVRGLATVVGYARPRTTLRLNLELWASLHARGDKDLGKFLTGLSFSEKYLAALPPQAVQQVIEQFGAHPAPGTTPRTERDDLLLFCVHLAGSGRLLQHGRVAELGAGVGVLYEARSAWVLDVATDVQRLLLQFPRDLLPLRPAEISGGLARGMDPQAPAVRLLSGYIGQLFQLADELSGEQRVDAGLAGIELLVMALRGATVTVPADHSAGAVLLGVMRAHVREHLADPLLTVAEPARRHHVSVRHTHALFSRIGVTPGAYLREQRLLAARALLSDPKHGMRTVSDIGAAVGMGELRTFERAFQRQFGTTPARWRLEHVTSAAL